MPRERILSLPFYVHTNDIENVGEGGRIVLHASPAYLRRLGQEAAAVRMEEAGIMQAELVINCRTDAAMEGYPSTRKAMEANDYLITLSGPGEAGATE